MKASPPTAGAAKAGADSDRAMAAVRAKGFVIVFISGRNTFADALNPGSLAAEGCSAVMAGSRHATALGIELHGHASHDQAPPPVATATASVGCRRQHPSAQESFTLFIRVNSVFRFAAPDPA
ncbi:hypothetical protein D9M71_636570 [compost metagenome]